MTVEECFIFTIVIIIIIITISPHNMGMSIICVLLAAYFMCLETPVSKSKFSSSDDSDDSDILGSRTRVFGDYATGHPESPKIHYAELDFNKTGKSFNNYEGAIDYEPTVEYGSGDKPSPDADDLGVYHGKAHYYHDRSVEGHLKLKEKMDPIFREELDDAERDNGWHGNNEY